MNVDELDTKTASSDGLQPKKADLNCIHALNEHHLHEIHVDDCQHPNPRGIFINQSKYALESLKKYGYESCDPVDTPMVEKSKLDEDKEGQAVDQSQYRGMIGTLLYLTASRPDLQFAICMCDRYQARLTEKHFKNNYAKVSDEVSHEVGDDERYADVQQHTTIDVEKYGEICNTTKSYWQRNIEYPKALLHRSIAQVMRTTTKRVVERYADVQQHTTIDVEKYGEICNTTKSYWQRNIEYPKALLHRSIAQVMRTTTKRVVE
nr:uncharacterized mitochondrial protein AtMg00810-like [Tanacetum cinerariifolium]